MSSDTARARIAALVGNHTVVRDGHGVPVWQAIGAQNVEQIAAAVHDDLREQIAQEILSNPRLRPEQFAWLQYPTYMRGVRSGMEFAAEIARGNVPDDPRTAGVIADG